MNKYDVFLHMTSGRTICITLDVDGNIEDSATQDCVANALFRNPVMHHFKNGRLEIFNMDNVESITVAKAEEEVAE